MALLKHNKTIPELFEFLTEEYGKNTGKFLMMRKVDNKFTGITYDEFREQTENLALGLAVLGTKKGDKVAIIAENRPEWVYSDMAILGLGAIDVPIYPSLTPESIEFILENSESRGVIVSNKLQLNKVLKVRQNLKFLQFIVVMNERDPVEGETSLYLLKEVQDMGKAFGSSHPGYFRNIMKTVKEHDLCTIIYTSGTTGEPKGVMLTHHNILSNVTSALETYPIGKDDIFLSFLPLCHIFERMGGYYTGFSSGGVICYAESIETVAQNVLEVKPTILTTVPRLFERIYAKIIKNVESQSVTKQKIFEWAINVGREYVLARKENRINVALNAKHKIADKLVYSKLREKLGGRLRFFISGGAALPIQIGEFFESIGILILEGYGLTESSPVICANRIDDYKFGTVGKPFPGVEIKIAPDGEILARGANIMQGYYKNKKETAETIKDGWLHTGDIGEFDAEGFLMITDRKKHLFKTSTGKYIAPSHIENLFLSSKFIDQFILVGDKRMFLTALVVPDFDLLKEYAEANKISYKNFNELVKRPEVHKLIDKEIADIQKKLANYERVRKFTILDHQFTLESGEITPSLKVRRKFIEERYQHLIDYMYSDNK